MAVFVIGEPVTGRVPVVEVDPLPVGRHRFQVVAITRDGRRSDPAVFEFVVQRPVIVGPVLPPIDRPVLRPDPVGPVVQPLDTTVVQPVRPIRPIR